MLAYNPQFVLLIAIIFNVLTVMVITGLLEYKGQVKKALGAVFPDITYKVNYFPRYFSTRAITCYVVTLIVVSAIFLDQSLPLQFVAFGFFSVLLFFHFATKLTMGWRRYSHQQFTSKLFITALLIRVTYVLFIYFYYNEMTGGPFAYHAGDELFYHQFASVWRNNGLGNFVEQLGEYVMLSDTGYCWLLGLEYRIFGCNVLPARFLKCLIDASICMLIYNLAERSFGEVVGRIAAIFYMLLPNTWYYCGITLKETEMVFLLMLFVERSDLVFHFPKIKFKDLLLPILCVVIMFTFRTALAAVMLASMIAAVILSSGKQLLWWKKVLFSIVVGVTMLFAVGSELMEETQQLWQGRFDSQEIGYGWRAEVENGNTFAKYASASVFAPLIFTIPFSTLVNVVGQENQMMLNGAYFIKNILSGFVIFSLLILLFRGDWRKHALPIAVLCGYMVVLVFSNFAHSERFHFPALPLEMVFAAFGVTQVTNRHKYWYLVWIVFIAIANILWCLIKLKGRGIV